MMLVLLLLRTAIGLLSGGLVWLLVTLYAPSWGAMAAAVLGGFGGGMVCMSLGPSTGQQIALTAGLVATVVAFATVWQETHPHNWALNYWPVWILPGFMAGAACWLLSARWLQNSKGSR